MKKILFCLIALLTMSSCTCNNDTHKPDAPDVSPLSFASVIEVVKIEGHLYIVYVDGYGGGICHAEHCPCRNNNLK